MITKQMVRGFLAKNNLTYRELAVMADINPFSLKKWLDKKTDILLGTADRLELAIMRYMKANRR